MKGSHVAGGTPVHNPAPPLMRSILRAVRASAVLAAVPVGLLVAGAGAALAAGTGTTAQPESTTVTFGLLGPVGLVAIALGIIGMTAGVLRQRRKARSAVAAEPAAGDVPALAHVVLTEHPTRPELSPIHRT